MNENLHIEDGSNDRIYFTMVPNIILNHSGAIDQALYLQMKRFAGEKDGGGYCSASKRTLMGKMKVGPRALNTSLEYLIEHKWIEKIGSRSVMTQGGPQDIDVYRVNDIWKLNTDFYKGANEIAPLDKVLTKSTKVLTKSIKGANETHTTKNNTYKTINTSESKDSQEITIVCDSSREEPRGYSKYPHAREVFGWFSKPQKSWRINSTELKYAEILYERGEKNVKGAIAFCIDHEEDEFSPKVNKPSDLEKKWLDILAYRKKH